MNYKKTLGVVRRKKYNLHQNQSQSFANVFAVLKDKTNVITKRLLLKTNAKYILSVRKYGVDNILTSQ